MIEFRFENYIVSFPENTSYLIYDDDYCYGIKIFDGCDQYELIHNRQVNWSRIYIVKNNVIKDIPFKKSTIDLFPEHVKVNNP